MTVTQFDYMIIEDTDASEFVYEFQAASDDDASAHCYDALYPDHPNGDDNILESAEREAYIANGYRLVRVIERGNAQG